MAGSVPIATSMSAKLPRACDCMSLYCPSMNRAFCTLALLLAKWLCQNSVIFSRSGCAVLSMRSWGPSVYRQGAVLLGVPTHVDPVFRARDVQLGVEGAESLHERHQVGDFLTRCGEADAATQHRVSHERVG